MKNQSLIYALSQLKADILNHDRKAALLTLAKLEHCIKNCECVELADLEYPAIIEDAHYGEGLPTSLRVQAGLPLEDFEEVAPADYHYQDDDSDLRFEVQS